MTGQDKRNLETVRLLYTGDEAERANVAGTLFGMCPDTTRCLEIITAMRNTPN